MPFDKLKAPSAAEWLRVDTERRFLLQFENRGLALSNASTEVSNFPFQFFDTDTPEKPFAEIGRIQAVHLHLPLIG